MINNPCPDQGLERFREIRQEYEDYLSGSTKVTEADTRANFLDRVIAEVLFWPSLQVRREEHTHSGYIDYTMSLQGRPFFVVEAKKDAVTFPLPTPRKRKRYKISGVLSGAPTIKGAIDQVRGYCDDIAARYAAVTNGETWIVFRAIRDDMPWREGMARVFYSRDHIEKEFVEFWNLLSFEAVSAGSLDRELGPSIRTERRFLRVVDGLFRSEIPLERNRLHAQLHPLVEGVFRDITDKQQLGILHDCYVHTKSLRIITDDLTHEIRDAIPARLKSEGTVDIGPGARKRERQLFEKEVGKSLKSDQGQLFILLGGIGCGKTTFIKRYLRTIGRENLDANGAWFYIDFLEAPADSREAEEFVWKTVLTSIWDRYSELKLESREHLELAFADEIEALEATVLSGKNDNDRTDWISSYLADWQRDLTKYVTKILQSLRHLKRSVVLVIDNVDQLPPEYQADVFVLAQSIRRRVNSTTLVSMREESYYAATLQKSFTAFSTRKFHIASPRFTTLVKNRIEFAEKLLKLPDEGAKLALGCGISLDRDSLLSFLEIMRASIFQENRNIVRFVESVCFGNMRLALKMFTDFLISGATDVDKMITIHRNQGSYYVAFHEFLKSVMLGDKRYYHEEASSVVNLFDVGKEANASHFTALRILRLLWDSRGVSSPQGKSFVEINPLIHAFEDAFDNREDFIRTANRLVMKQLVEVNNRSTETIGGSTHMKITSSGWYYLRFLVSKFSYLDLILQDTPLNSKEVADRLIKSVRLVDNLSRDSTKEE